MEDLKIVSGKEVRADPSHLFLTIFLYGAMEFFWPRTFESSGVENSPYVRARIRKTAILIKRVHLLRVFYPSLLQTLLPLFDSWHQALVEAFQNVDYMVLKWKHRIVFIT